ncbi:MULTISPECIES: hypothetical protein [Pasteurellaceae]|uniref:Uncharacterized protein n=1 Tax=Pasteurella atlantica TaxID=2827233 RepID=A0AAW8CIL9_9PAST|nr:hypothetical protein [Pasteurella atlantica]MBR0572636.1 hypothetical protein [Pasteurella atlantica]MDP8038582.1 hypothetical protein [Pasteurella atlantica]MDP8040674.1 hypothetical protein [Pasteurella atlantica]MDP8042809.1 hypothetical protein [Pasteurella atlantica]MDP8044896.1 hypothetical protein [Pasteurella atlantica]
MKTPFYKPPFYLFILSSLAFADQGVLPYWQQQMESISVQLDEMQKLYKMGNKKAAIQTKTTAQFTYYKNSELESSIRTNYSMRFAEEINQKFSNLSTELNAEGDHFKNIQEIANNIQNDIKKTLIGLPLTPKLKEQRKNQLAKEKAQQIENKNYGADILALNQALTKIQQAYQQHQVATAIKLIQDSYYTYWQQSNLEEKVDSQYRQDINRDFDRLYRSIQQHNQESDIVTQIKTLKIKLATDK